MESLLYYKPYLFNDVVYSVDKVRVSFRFLSDDALLDFVRDGLSSDDCKFYQSQRSFSYKYLLTFNGGMSTYTVACGFLRGVGMEKSGWLEFNPNKVLGAVQIANGFIRCKDSPFADSSAFDYAGLFMQRFRYLRSITKVWELRRFDFAVDVHVVRSSIQLVKDKRKYSLFFKSSEDMTEYLGCGSNPGFVKVYNKQLESDLSSPLTRIEVTLDSLAYDDFLSRWPDVYYINTDPASSEYLLCQLLHALPPEEFNKYYKQLSYYQRKKLDPILLRAPFVPPEDAFIGGIMALRDFL